MITAPEWGTLINNNMKLKDLFKPEPNTFLGWTYSTTKPVDNFQVGKYSDTLNMKNTIMYIYDPKESLQAVADGKTEKICIRKCKWYILKKVVSNLFKSK